VYVEKTEKEEFLVFNLLPMNIDNEPFGCRAYVVEDDPIVRFREICRSIIFNSEGQVLAGSYPQATPLRRVSWKYDHGFLYKNDDS
jgi:hypothetical protein